MAAGIVAADKRTEAAETVAAGIYYLSVHLYSDSGMDCKGRCRIPDGCLDSPASPLRGCPVSMAA